MNGYLIAGLLVAIIVLLLATNKKLVETLKNMYKIEELRKRIFYTIGLLLVYRLGCFVSYRVSTPICWALIRLWQTR